MSYNTYVPVGVCAFAVSWVSPLYNVLNAIGMTLASGNTAVISVSELTPLSSLKVAEMLNEINIPPGVINIITSNNITQVSMINNSLVKTAIIMDSTKVSCH